MIIPINKLFRPQVNNLIKNEWAGPIVVTKGVSHDTSESCGFVSVIDGNLTGYILYLIKDRECEILVLQSLEENCGIGTSLINAVINTAREQDCNRVWLITTNDNTHAIRYYYSISQAV